MKDFSGRLKGKKIVTGNPMVIKTPYSKEQGAEILNIPYTKERKWIGVLGGSQGAEAVNRWILENSEELIQKGYSFLISTGAKNYSKIREKITDKNIFIFDFVREMGAFYELSDYIICRSGASTISELLYLNKKAVFIPYPYASDNHQYYNALFASEYLNCILIEEKDLKENRLIDTIQKLENDENKKQEISFKNALARIYEEVLDDFKK